MSVFQVAALLIGLMIFAALCYSGFALWELHKKMDSNALAAQVAQGTPIDISQVRAMEQRLIDAINQGQVRTNALLTSFEQYTQNLSAQLTAITQKYQAAIAASPVDTNDYSQDMAQLQQAIDNANAIGLGTLADFITPPPPQPDPVPAPPDPNAPPIDPNAPPESATDTATAAATQNAADQQAVAQAGDPNAPPAVAVPAGSTVDTHPETGAVTVTLPAGTVVNQAAPSDTPSDAPADTQEGAGAGTEQTDGTGGQAA